MGGLVVETPSIHVITCILVFAPLWVLTKPRMGFCLLFLGGRRNLCCLLNPCPIFSLTASAGGWTFYNQGQRRIFSSCAEAGFVSDNDCTRLFCRLEICCHGAPLGPSLVWGNKVRVRKLGRCVMLTPVAWGQFTLPTPTVGPPTNLVLAFCTAPDLLPGRPFGPLSDSMG